MKLKNLYIAAWGVSTSIQMLGHFKRNGGHAHHHNLLCPTHRKYEMNRCVGQDCDGDTFLLLFSFCWGLGHDRPSKWKKIREKWLRTNINWPWFLIFMSRPVNGASRLYAVNGQLTVLCLWQPHEYAGTDNNWPLIISFFTLLEPQLKDLTAKRRQTAVVVHKV